MEVITWACFFGFVALVSFLIYNTLSKSSEDDMFEEEKAQRRKNINIKHNNVNVRMAAEKAKEKKLKKQKKQNQKKANEQEAARNIETAESEIESPIDEGSDNTEFSYPAQPAAPPASKKNKGNKAPSNEVEKNETKKTVPKPEVKAKTSVTPVETADIPHTKEDKKAAKKAKQAVEKAEKAEKASQQTKKPKIQDKPTEIKKPIENEKSDVVEEEKEIEIAIAPAQQQTIPVVKKETVAAKPVQALPVANSIKSNLAKTSKKKKNIAANLQLGDGTEAVPVNLLMNLIQVTELSRSENQLIIDALLNKQNEDLSEWLQGRQDPLAKLRKQLLETEQILKDEKDAVVGLQIKLKELRSEINNEKSAHRVLEERLLNTQNECIAYTMKLQQAMDDKQSLALQHSTCIQQIKQFQKQLNDEKLAALKLKEEHTAAEEQYHDAIRAVQNEYTEYAVTQQQLQAETSNLRAQLAMVQEQSLIVNEEYLKSKNELERILSESQFQVTKLQNDLSAAGREINEVRDELSHVTVMYNNSVLENQNLSEQKDRLTSQVSSLHTELKNLRDQNEVLSKNRSDNWENGFSYNNKPGLAEYDARLEEMDRLLNAMKNEVDSKTNKIEELNTVILAFKNENSKKDTLLLKAQAENDSLKASLTPTKIIDDNVSQLKDSINEKNKEIGNLKNEIETYKQRNNELRNKNWKVVEALKQAEERSQQIKCSKQSSDDLPKENNLDAKVKNWVKTVVLKYEPSLVVEDKGNTDITPWLAKVESILDSKSSIKQESCDNCPKAMEYMESCQRLETVVNNYQKILSDTEGMLNDLQNNAETLESDYKERIKSLEEQLEQCRKSPQLLEVDFMLR